MWTAVDVVKSVGADPGQWRVTHRGIRMEQFRNLSSQEGADGGIFELVS